MLSREEIANRTKRLKDKAKKHNEKLGQMNLEKN